MTWWQWVYSTEHDSCSWFWRILGLEINIPVDKHYHYRLFREKPGVISPGPVWVFLDPDGYMYLHESLLCLFYILLTEWRHDRHLAG
jgi:hypothetical protein